MSFLKQIIYIGWLTAIVGFIILLNGIFLTTGTWKNILTQIGPVLIGAGAIQLVSYYFTSKSLAESIASESHRISSLPIHSFHEKREGLYDIIDRVIKSKEVWHAWHTGRVASTQISTFFSSNRKYRVLLMDPECLALDELAKVVVTDTATNMKADIESLTKALDNINIIEWNYFPGPMMNSVTIGNPNDEDGWANVEPHIPLQDVGLRPNFTIEKKTSPILFNTLVKSYEAMWQKGMNQ